MEYRIYECTLWWFQYYIENNPRELERKLCHYDALAVLDDNNYLLYYVTDVQADGEFTTAEEL